MKNLQNTNAAGKFVCLLLLFMILTPAGNAKSYQYPDSWIEDTLERMSLREKVGQMITVSYSGYYMNRNSEDFQHVMDQIREFKVGGFILYKGTVIETAILTNSMQAVSDVPLLIASDLERGLGNQLDNSVHFPFNMTFGAADSEELAYQHGRITALEGRAAGVHQIYGPVVDVNNNPDNPIINVRAYGGTPDLVSRMAEQFIRGAQDNGMIATAKHFPGHGDTGTDTHSRLAVIEAPREHLDEVELKPFQVSIDAGVKSIMSAHISVPALDESGLPATLSYKIMSGLLRDEMKFDGLIVSDAMGMGGIVNDHSIVEGSIEAVKAGNDILLVPINAKFAIEGLLSAVEGGKLSEERIDESVRRILKAKQWLGLDNNRFVDLDKAANIIDHPEHREIARQTAEKSITLLRNKDNIVPLDPAADQNVLILTVTSDVSTDQGNVFRRSLGSRLKGSSSAYIDLRTNDLEFENIEKMAQEADLIVCGTFIRIIARKDYIALAPQQEAYFRRLLSLGKPVIVAAFGNPYVIRQFPDIETYLCTFNYLESSEEPAANAVLGLQPITGKLPVDIPEMHNTGEGIQIAQREKVSAEGRLLEEGDPFDAGFTKDFSERLSAVLQSGVDNKVAPAVVCAVGRQGKNIFRKAFGSMTYEEDSPAVTVESIFDLASVTKVTATTTLAMIFYSRGLLDLDAPVSRYLPEMKEGKRFTVRNCLTHTTGLPAFKRFYQDYSGREEILEQIYNTELNYEPGTQTVYSDIGMMIMATILEGISGRSLDELFLEEVADPLGMDNTMYNPPENLFDTIVPTEDDPWRGRVVRGEVHDENAFAYGGVSGHAGLFSTVGDLSKLAQMYLNKGISGNTMLVKEDAIELFTRRANVVPGSPRGLGWWMFDLNSPGGRYLSDNAFGHTGYTGTSIWIDPEEDMFIILFTNRVHPTRENTKISGFRKKVHNTVCEMIRK
ncbi:glycoside hydrolase family 3 N-terminal domain-containing protein [candidate division KSB1 bacterium]